MLARIFKKGRGSFRKRIRYIYGLTKHNHAVHNFRTISTNCGIDPAAKLKNGDESDLNLMIAQFDMVEMMRNMTLDSEEDIAAVWHTMISLQEGETLTDEEWKVIIKIYKQEMGFTDDNLDVSTIHPDTNKEHTHLVVNRIRSSDYKVVGDANEKIRSYEIIDRIEDICIKMGFPIKKAPPPELSGSVSLSRKEEANKHINGLPANFREMIADRLARTLKEMRKEDCDYSVMEFVKRLRKKDVYVHLTLNKREEVTGITYEYKGDHIAGSQLKRMAFSWGALVGGKREIEKENAIHDTPAGPMRITQRKRLRHDPERVAELVAETKKRGLEIRESEETRAFLYYEFRTEMGSFYIRFRNKGPVKDYQNYKSKKEREEAELARIIALLIEMILAFLFGGRMTSIAAIPSEPGQHYYTVDPYRMEPYLPGEFDPDMMPPGISPSPQREFNY